MQTSDVYKVPQDVSVARNHHCEGVGTGQLMPQEGTTLQQPLDMAVQHS